MRTLIVAAVVALVAPSAGAIGHLDSTSIIFMKQGTDSLSRFGKEIGLLGDVNGDGFSDIAVCMEDSSGSLIFHGGNPPDTIADGFIPGNFGARVAGDLNGDGIDDVISIRLVLDSSGVFHGSLLFCKGYGDSLGSVPYDSLAPPGGNGGFGLIWQSAYLDDDSLLDLLVVAQEDLIDPTIRLYSGPVTHDSSPVWSLIYPFEGHHRITDVALVDFNGDGQLDICVAYGYNGVVPATDTGYVYIYNGPNFAPQPSVILGYPPEVEPDYLEPGQFAQGLYDVGDVNGDEWGDIAVNYNRYILIYLGGPTADTVFDAVLQYDASNVCTIGDINDDGYSDIAGYGYAGDPFHIVEVYLCGPAFDTVMDDQMIRYDLPPWFLDNIGWRISPAGDFNGDGIDDFMFSCKNFAYGWRGAVFVVGGSPNIATDVEGGEQGGLPGDFHLAQNYPNPFNLETTIEFELPYRSHVTMSVVNVLGQTVRTLIDGELGTGRHRVSWDGRDERGEVVASGAYLYRLTAGEYTESRTMVLVK